MHTCACAKLGSNEEMGAQFRARAYISPGVPDFAGIVKIRDYAQSTVFVISLTSGTGLEDNDPPESSE